MTVKQPTAQGISRLLGAAGFEKSESSATRIKGWRNSSDGYQASKRFSGGVEVEHNLASGGSPEWRTSERDKMLGQYAEAIAAAGWSVERQEFVLVVTAAPEGS